MGFYHSNIRPPRRQRDKETEVKSSSPLYPGIGSKFNEVLLHKERSETNQTITISSIHIAPDGKAWYNDTQAPPTPRAKHACLCAQIL